MKRFLPLALLALAIGSAPVLADCVADLSVSEAKRAYQQGQALEAKGQLWEAINEYDRAQGYVCETGGNPVAQQALVKAMALGTRQGKSEEQKGNLFNDGKPIGAFQWYEKGARFADADHVLIAALKKAPDNMPVAAFAQEHFKLRAQDYFANNNRAAITLGGGYQLDPGYEPYVANLPTANIQRLLNSYQSLLPETYLQALAQLAQQKDAIKPGDQLAALKWQQASHEFVQHWHSSDTGTGGKQGDRLEAVRDLFAQAWQWTQQVRDYRAADSLRAKIDQARLAHAERLLKSYTSTATLWESARDVYRDLDQSAQLNLLTQKAKTYADQAMTAGYYQRASEFYYLIEDYDNEQLARTKLEAQAAQVAQQLPMASAAQLAELQKLYSNPQHIQELQQQAINMQQQLEEQARQARAQGYMPETEEE